MNHYQSNFIGRNFPILSADDLLTQKPWSIFEAAPHDHHLQESPSFLLQNKQNPPEAGGELFIPRIQSHLNHRPPKTVTTTPKNSSPISSNNRTRMKWSEDLHKQFVGCVDRLGGPKNATPKGILELMDNIYGLTIFQVKSHLQKYRITAKYLQDPIEGISKVKTPSDRDSMSSINSQKTMVIGVEEALRLQLEVQRDLHQQLEEQRDLQSRIEEQGRTLKLMLEQQQLNTNQDLD